MSISSIGQSFVAAAQNVSGGGGSQKPSAMAAAQAESLETISTTMKEANAGDRMAMKKMAAIEAAKQQKVAEATKPAEPGKGEAIDASA